MVFKLEQPKNPSIITHDTAASTQRPSRRLILVGDEGRDRGDRGQRGGAGQHFERGKDGHPQTPDVIYVPDGDPTEQAKWDIAAGSLYDPYQE